MCLSWIDTPWSRYTFCTSLDEVLLRLADAPDLEQLLRIARRLVLADDRVARTHLVTVRHREPLDGRHRVRLLRAVVGDDRDDTTLALVLRDAHDTRRTSERRLALRGTSLEQLDDAGQTAGDVGAGDATGVERPHRQLRAGLTDRLRRDHADRFAQLDRLAGRQ